VRALLDVLGSTGRSQTALTCQRFGLVTPQRCGRGTGGLVAAYAAAVTAMTRSAEPTIFFMV